MRAGGGGGGDPSCNSPNTSGGGGRVPLAIHVVQIQAGGGGGGGGVPLLINTFRVGDKTLASCFVTYSIHQGVLSASPFDAPLCAHYTIICNAVISYCA